MRVIKRYWLTGRALRLCGVNVNIRAQELYINELLVIGIIVQISSRVLGSIRTVLPFCFYASPVRFMYVCLLLHLRRKWSIYFALLLRSTATRRTLQVPLSRDSGPEAS